MSKWVIPYHVWNHVRYVRLNNIRRRRLEESHKTEDEGTSFNYDEAVDFIVSCGCERTQVTEGSIPKESLDYTATFLDQLNYEKGVTGLHIGNFVGISLAYITDYVVRRNNKSLVVSIDPNIRHRGIEDPMSLVIKLLNKFELQSNSLILTGYSLNKSITNDGKDEDGNYKIDHLYSDEPSCAQQLTNLKKVAAGRFDFAIIDGNHEAKYLQRELKEINHLLKNNGLLILDDVSYGWFEIEDVFKKLDESEYEKLGADGRVGIARKIGE